MVEKRYQVFLSSTYADLREERKQVLHAILDAGCIPVGMESFPANDNEAWDFIEAVIRDCDYYVLIMAGKYGSEAKDGKSYTQKEYEYARSQGIPVLAFPFHDIGKLIGDRLEADEKRRGKLADFRRQVLEAHIVKYWETSDGLKHAVLQALNHAQRTTPREGWIRARYAMNADSLNELEQLRKRVAELDQDDDLFRQTYAADDDEVVLEMNYSIDALSKWYATHGADEEPPAGLGTEVCDYEYPSTWAELLSVIGPRAFSPMEQGTIQMLLTEYFRQLVADDLDCPENALSVQLHSQQVELVAIQLAAMGHLQPVQITGGPHWELTNRGRQKVYLERAIKRRKKKDKADGERPS